MKEVTLTKENFSDEVLKSEQKVLVDFWATWCYPCKTMLPIIDELSEELKDTVKIGKVDVDEEDFLAAAFGIRSIPGFIIFEGGKPVRKTVGSMTKEDLVKFIEGDVDTEESPEEVEEVTEE